RGMPRCRRAVDIRGLGTPETADRPIEATQDLRVRIDRNPGILHVYGLADPPVVKTPEAAEHHRKIIRMQRRARRFGTPGPPNDNVVPLGCQSALTFDPRSASNRDPLSGVGSGLSR